MTDQTAFSASGERFSRDYDLGERKAQAMLDLLKPADVSVTVGKEGSRISITGRAWEVNAIDSLVELVMRKHGQDKDAVAEYIDRALDASRTSEKYRLPKHKREALHHILAFDDVPVLAGQKRKRVTVEATREDQETIRAVVDILRGKRSRCDGIGCLLGFHSSRCRLTPQDRFPHDMKILDRITVPPVPEPPSDR